MVCYAQGGRGNSRLVAWEGERTVTFTMEDALISPEGFMILSGAGLIEGSANEKINVHVAENTDGIIVDGKVVYVVVDQVLSTHKDATIYVMPMVNDQITTEPFIGTAVVVTDNFALASKTDANDVAAAKAAAKEGKLVKIDAIAAEDGNRGYLVSDIEKLQNAKVAKVDYYTEKAEGTMQIDITPDKFGGNYYLEASTLFRDQQSGADYPAEFIIPNCKIQSNFTFSMASSGDPSELMRLAA